MEFQALSSTQEYSARKPMESKHSKLHFQRCLEAPSSKTFLRGYKSRRDKRLQRVGVLREERISVTPRKGYTKTPKIQLRKVLAVESAFLSFTFNECPQSTLNNNAKQSGGKLVLQKLRLPGFGGIINRREKLAALALFMFLIRGIYEYVQSLCLALNTILVTVTNVHYAWKNL